MTNFVYYDEDEEIYVPVFEHKEGGYCRYFVLNGPIFRQAAGYASMYRDLEDCIEAIKYYINIMDSPSIPDAIRSGLLFSSVVKYARCFTDASEGRKIKLDKEDVFRSANKNVRRFHDKTMDLRHKYLAHAGDSEHEVRASVVILNPRKKNIEKVIFAGMNLKDDDSHIFLYRDLYVFTTKHVENKLDQLKEVINERVEEFDIDDIYELSKEISKDEIIEVSDIGPIGGRFEEE